MSYAIAVARGAKNGYTVKLSLLMTVSNSFTGMLWRVVWKPFVEIEVGCLSPAIDKSKYVHESGWVGMRREGADALERTPLKSNCRPRRGPARRLEAVTSKGVDIKLTGV